MTSGQRTNHLVVNEVNETARVANLAGDWP